MTSPDTAAVVMMVWRLATTVADAVPLVASLVPSPMMVRSGAYLVMQASDA